MPMNFMVNQMTSPRVRHTAPPVVSGPKQRRKSLISMTELVSLYQRGATWDQMEEATGYGHKEIRKWLKREGVYRPRKYLTDTQLQRALDMRADGHTWAEVALEIGYTPAGIQRALKNKGMM